MGNFDINLSEQDETQLKTLAKDTAYSRLAGSFQQYAAGEMALGAGQGMAQGGRRRAVPSWPPASAWAARPPPRFQPGPPPPPGTTFAGGGPGYASQAQAGAICSNCQASNQAGAKFCASCGTSLAPPAVVCSNCHADNPEGAKFCASCGTSLAPAVAHCTACGAEVSPGGRFCPSCGNSSEGPSHPRLRPASPAQ